MRGLVNISIPTARAAGVLYNHHIYNVEVLGFAPVQSIHEASRPIHAINCEDVHVGEAENVYIEKKPISNKLSLIIATIKDPLSYDPLNRLVIKVEPRGIGYAKCYSLPLTGRIYELPQL